ncbi:MAG: hypothetical protein ACREPQ_00375 [Rhodanobacter sp.]
MHAQAYTFSGYVQGQTRAAAQLHRGSALAFQPTDVIEAMTEAGFVVVAMASLDDVQRMIDLLDGLRLRDADMVPGEDFLMTDVMERHTGPLAAEQVFTFAGMPRHHTGAAMAGCMIAENADALTRHLGSFGFLVESVASQAELQLVRDHLQCISEGQFEPTECLDLREAETDSIAA